MVSKEFVKYPKFVLKFISMKTLVAITSQNRKSITEHAGRCRNFFIYTIVNDRVVKKELLELSSGETLHEVFHSEKPTHSVLFDVDILLTGGIGNGAIQKLAVNNVTCYIVREKDPDEAISKLMKGVLEAIAPVSHKSDCDHHHDHDHGHHHRY